jgi:L-threonylcarbamoyladenylate synthase
MFAIKKLTPPAFNENIDLAVNYLLGGRIIIYPTDTSYGIGGLTTSKLAIEKISELKNREEGKYYSVIVPNLNWVIKNLEVNTSQRKILEKYLPGEYTFILNTLDKKSTLGIRIPNNDFIRRVSARVSRPFTATSANIATQPSAYSLEDLKKGILNQPNIKQEDILVLDGGQLQEGKQSTIIDLTQKKPEIIREGSGKFKLNY